MKGGVSVAGNAVVTLLPVVQFRNTQVHAILLDAKLCILPDRQKGGVLLFFRPDLMLQAVPS